MAQSKPIDLGVHIGQVFLDKYRVEAILGHGGMGVVAQCVHLQLGGRVAIKMLRPDVILDLDAVERFKREAQAASKLKSEYVARVSDVDVFPDTGVPYMVMEFLEGQDLDQLIAERGFLPIPWAVELMLQTAEALAEAHSINIVHRDVKPSNLFVTWRSDGTPLVKVLDFGISKSPTGSDMQLTQTQSLLGTPAYMSPEQMRSARLVDARTDMWSLGTVLYEIIEGHRPFDAESFSEMCVKVAVDQPTPMQKAPPALQQIVMRCLAKVPEQRYASMAELGRELVPFAQDQAQASVLVDRMVRLHRRSQGDWDISTSGQGLSAIRDARDKSAPITAPWTGPTPIPATPVPVSVPMSVPVSTPLGRAGSEGSQPYLRPPDLATTMRNPSRRRFAWIAVAAGAVGIGISLGVVLAGRGVERKDEPKGTTVEMKPDVVQPPPAVAQPTPDESAKPAATAVVPPTPPTPAPVPTPPPVEPKVVVDQTVETHKVPVGKQGSKQVSKQVSKQPPKTATPPPVQHVEPPPPPPPPKKEPPPASGDPFANRTGGK